MGFIKEPHFPSENVSLLVTDQGLESGIKDKLLQWGIDLIEIPRYAGICPSVSGHPDMQMVHLAENVLLCHPHFPKALAENLQNRGFVVHYGNTVLGKKYPLDIAYNIAIVGKIAFHNTKYTDPVLKEQLKKHAIRLVHVNQGYAKCSLLPVTPDSIITADPAISEVAIREGMDVLRIPPQKSIRLPGFDYGFIGGTAGFIARNRVAFTGNLERMDSKEKIKVFLKKQGVQWVQMGEERIRDYGGLIPLYEK